MDGAKQVFLSGLAAPDFVGLEEEEAGEVGKIAAEGPHSKRWQKYVMNVFRLSEDVNVHVCRVGAVSVEAVEEAAEGVLTVMRIARGALPTTIEKEARAFVEVPLALRTVFPMKRLEGPGRELQDHVRILMNLAVVRQNPLDTRHSRGMTKSGVLFSRAKRWKTADARKSMRLVLDEANVRPQVVEREGREYLVIEKELYENWGRSKTAEELAAHFEKEPLPHLEIGQDHGPPTIPTIRLGTVTE